MKAEVFGVWRLESGVWSPASLSLPGMCPLLPKAAKANSSPKRLGATGNTPECPHDPGDSKQMHGHAEEIDRPVHRRRACAPSRGPAAQHDPAPTHHEERFWVTPVLSSHSPIH